MSNQLTLTELNNYHTATTWTEDGVDVRNTTERMFADIYENSNGEFDDFDHDSDSAIERFENSVLSYYDEDEKPNDGVLSDMYNVFTQLY